jgi:hypothetical protein
LELVKTASSADHNVGAFRRGFNGVHFPPGNPGGGKHTLVLAHAEGHGLAVNERSGELREVSFGEASPLHARKEEFYKEKEKNRMVSTSNVFH